VKAVKSKELKDSSFRVSSESMPVSAPEGYSWLSDSGRYYLKKGDEGSNNVDFKLSR
jgi:hypothetical protein